MAKLKIIKTPLLTEAEELVGDEVMYVVQEGKDRRTSPQGLLAYVEKEFPGGGIGPKGEDGKDGIDGIDGVDGVDGQDGDQGIQGEQGEPGPQGADGTEGAQGDKGEIGETGTQGPQGIQGELGPKGIQGNTGPKGDKGETGAAGADGSPDTEAVVKIKYESNPDTEVFDTAAKNKLAAFTATFTSALKTAYDNVVTWVATNGASLLSHLTNKANPHEVTAAQVGLSNVSNTSDANKPISTAVQTALSGKIDNNLAGSTSIAPYMGGDVHNISTSGIGYVGGSTLNMPDGLAGVAIVGTLNPYTTKHAFIFYGAIAGANDDVFYYKRRLSGAYTPWFRVASREFVASTYAPKTGNSDIEITDATKGIILKSPDGSRWRETIDNTGARVMTKL